eukprot:130873-Prorocentrum_minimum.AAC.1
MATADWPSPRALLVQVYNEVVYDLLQHNSGPLELREDPDQVRIGGLEGVWRGSRGGGALTSNWSTWWVQGVWNRTDS